MDKWFFYLKNSKPNSFYTFSLVFYFKQSKEQTLFGKAFISKKSQGPKKIIFFENLQKGSLYVKEQSQKIKLEIKLVFLFFQKWIKRFSI